MSPLKKLSFSMFSWSIYKHEHSLYTLESKVYYLQVGYVIKTNWRPLEIAIK